jgi:hypothetical protein
LPKSAGPPVEGTGATSGAVFTARSRDGPGIADPPAAVELLEAAERVFAKPSRLENIRGGYTDSATTTRARPPKRKTGIIPSLELDIRASVLVQAYFLAFHSIFESISEERSDSLFVPSRVPYLV